MNYDMGTEQEKVVGGRKNHGLCGLVLAACLVSVVGCDSLLEVDLPDAITDEVLDDPNGADIQVNSVIAQVECGYTAFTIEAAGFEDSFQATTAVGSGYADYSPRPGGGTCDTGATNFSWFDPLMIARSFGYDAYQRITDWTVAQVPDREEFLALISLYIAVSLDVFGEHFCDMAIDAGEMLTPGQTLDTAEVWVNRALAHLAITGDFEGLNDATTSLETMAYGLRARIRWANDDPLAAADAARVPDGYVAWATREVGEKRQNKPYEFHNVIAYGLVNGPIDYWTGDPFMGTTWPAIIPFTGYLDLGILTADGRAVSDAGYPITMADAGAEAETRVEHTGLEAVQGGNLGNKPTKYTSFADDIPLINWKEMQLILAEIEGGQSAIDRVNVIRTADGLPLVTYADPGDADQIEDMIIEERRRALWLEGRFWSTKIRNTDKLWFPRLQGDDQFQHDLLGGVRLALQFDEYDLNPNFDRGDQGSGCDGQWEDQKPDVGLGGL